MDDQIKRIVILTPTIAGADGISLLARESIRACTSVAKSLDLSVEVWSLAEEKVERLDAADPAVRISSAAGSKLRFTSWGITSALRGAQDTLVIVLHVAIAPVALPLVLRGAKLALLLLGVEAWRSLGRAESLALRWASTVIAISQFTAQRFKEFNPNFAKHRIDVCHLGVPRHRALQRSSGQVERFALIVGRMAAEERYKGHDLLIDIWPQVVARNPAAKLYIAGDGDDRKRLEQQAAQLGLNGHVRFLGRVSEEQLVELYRDCQFFVMPSTHEGFGLVFLEAMQAGKACIAGMGAAEEVVEDGVNGCIVDPKKPSEVCDALLTLFQNGESRSRMGLAGAQRYSNRFTDEHFRHRFQKSVGLI